MHNQEKYRNYTKRVSLLFAIIFLFLSANSLKAQVNPIDTVKGNHPVIIKNTAHSPQRAALLSTALPGLGQAYNKKYWKIPVVYAGLGGLGYSIHYNHQKYMQFRAAYRLRMDNDPSTQDAMPYYDEYTLKNWVTYFHRYRDLSVIGVALFYIVNIVDASVDAHLMSFDVSDDLSLNLQPSVYYTAYSSNYLPGLSLNIKF